MNLPLAIGLSRGLHMAGCYALFGTSLFSAVFIPSPPVALRRLAWGSLFIAVVAGFIWFLLQSADLAEAGSIPELLAALPLVALSTRFGHLLFLRGIALAATALCLQTGHQRIAASCSLIAVIAEAWLGHGGAMQGETGTVLLISAIIHLAAGAAWLGALPALFLMIARLPLGQAALLARRFSPFGLACVLALTGSAIVQFRLLIGSLGALFTSPYGRIALLKILLLAGLILLAALNRHRLAPALSQSARHDAKTALLTSIGLEICLGLLALLAAGLLLNLAPPRMAAMFGAQ